MAMTVHVYIQKAKKDNTEAGGILNIVCRFVVEWRGRKSLDRLGREREKGSIANSSFGIQSISNELTELEFIWVICRIREDEPSSLLTLV